MKKPQKSAVAITSVVLGIVSLIIMGVMKNSLLRIPFFKRILTAKNIGLDSLKDFLEISELHLRADPPAQSPRPSAPTELDGKAEVPKIEPIYSGTLVVWDGDGSADYLLLVSSEPIHKYQVFDVEDIEELDITKAPELAGTNWIRRTTVKGLSFRVPLVKFYCRVKSSNGRISREMRYPESVKVDLPDKEFNTWIFKSGSSHSVFLAKTSLGKKNAIYDCQIVLYTSDGKGLVRSIPAFDNVFEVKLGNVPPSLCFLTGVREIGDHFEQYVGWIKEDEALMKDYLVDYM